MMQNLVGIDGTYYDLAITSLKPTANITDGDNAGRSTNGIMIRDILGTYLSYVIEFEMKQYDLTEFSALVRKLRQPVKYVSMTVPDLDTDITFDAYITKVEYEYKGIIGGVRRWSGLKVTFTPMAPNIEPS